ncbi:hypothetical protein ZOSMA_98G00460 [Zostera marina]|uniref:Hyccin n=1 Tax=Zostera marina TaxID=29655 RepID=A0A0K9NHI1_ZOSMR|nr:hypothetical protein ZOSMA_98G00460 [Zostera marina]
MSEVASQDVGKAQNAIRSLHELFPNSSAKGLLESENPFRDLLHNTELGCDISNHLRQPTSGVGSDNVCRWLYDTFQSTDSELQMVVLRFIPVLLGVYLCGAISRKPLPGFEAVILAIYAHETKERGEEAMIVNVASMDNPSVYHEVTGKTKNNSNKAAVLGVVSPEMEPCGTVRATKRARICGVTLELYYSKISQMPISSKVEFCKLCIQWSGESGFDEELVMDVNKTGTEPAASNLEKGGRIPLPWELFQPAVRIVGHCLLGQFESVELRRKALEATKCLYARAVHDVQPQAILAARSLLRLHKFNRI